MMEKSFQGSSESLKGSLTPAYGSDDLIRKLKRALLRPFLEKKHRAKPVLLEEDFKGYNILRMGYLFYALAQSEGAFSLSKFKRGGYKSCFEAESVRELKRLISGAPDKSAPILKCEYERFNIISFAGRYYGISTFLGAVDLTTLEEDALKEYMGKGQCVVGDSVDEVKVMVEQNPIDWDSPVNWDRM